MAVRVQLLKTWTHPYRSRPYPVGTILQVLPSLAMEFLADKRAQLYNGEYPPKNKMKIKLSQLNNK